MNFLKRARNAKGQFASYGQAACHPERLHHARSMCRPCYEHWKYQNNPAPVRKRNASWESRNPQYHRRYLLQRRYGLTLAAFDELLKGQHNRCAICEAEFSESNPPRIDHDHQANKVRELLCNGCNTRIGHYENTGNWHQKAFEYLRKHNAPGLLNV